MFIGHYAVAFAAKRTAPKVSLGVLVGAASLLDLLWPVFLLLGWEVVRIEPGNTAVVPLAFAHYPIARSLVAAAGWSALCALLYFPAVVLLEGLMFAGGVCLYARGTRAKDAVGRYAFLGFVGFMTLVYAADLVGPPPPSWQAVAWVGLAAWLFPLWAEWFDRHRTR